MSGLGFGPGGIDCADVLDELYVYIDAETDDATRGRIRTHLEACAPCFRQYGIDQDVRAMIARCCGNDVAPAHLRERVRVRITQLTVETAYLEYRPD